MSGMHPPANLRCQIYFPTAPQSAELTRCENQGTHWEKWPGCGCMPCDPDVCEGDFYSWECDDGEHTAETHAVTFAAAARIGEVA